MGFVYTYHFFENDDSTTLVELSYQFSDRGLTYRTDPVRHVPLGALRCHLVLKTVQTQSQDSLSTEWFNELAPPTSGDSIARNVLGVRRLGIRPGAYTARIVVQDVNDPVRTGTTEFDVVVPAFPLNRFAMSSVQLADQLYPSDDEENPFLKNGYVVVPNVGGEIGGAVPIVTSYVEVYGADLVGSGRMEVVYQLAFGGTKEVFFQRADTLTGPFNRAIVLSDFLPVDSLPSGSYYLVVRASHGLRSQGGAQAMSATPFVLHNPDIDRMVAAGRDERRDKSGYVPASVDPIFAGMTEQELNREWSKGRHVAINVEINVWEQLNGIAAKGAFLTSFWQQRDQNPETPENEFREDYYKRAEEARVHFSTMLAPHGWDSDRGRILLQFGRPDGVDRHPQDFNVKPYEIWSYSSLGYEFVFVDRQQTGLYVLVHSTAPRETRDENWMDHFALINKKWVNE